MSIYLRSFGVTTMLGISVVACLFVPLNTPAQPNDPRPQDATTAILAAFDRYDVVGMNAGHNNQKQDDFNLSIIRNPELPSKVNDIVVECGNSRYQTILDRYIAGDSVSFEDARHAWRDTTVGMCSLSSFYAELFPLVRRINQGIPPQKRLRILLGEPPFDWSASPTDHPRLDRNARLASVMLTEVLAKKHKALILCGVGHLYHGEGTAVSIYDQKYPGRTLVVETHNGFAAFIDLDRGHQLEARMRTWPIPSLIPIKDSWLADLDLPYFLWPFPKGLWGAGKSISTLADAYLYLGPGDSLPWEKYPDSILDDQAYMAELAKRFGMNVENLRKRNTETHWISPAERQENLKFAPGAQFVGGYATTATDKPLVEIDFHLGRFSAKLPMTTSWVALTNTDVPNRYRAAFPSQEVSIEFEVVNGTVIGLVVDPGTGQPKMRLVYLP
jgi:hypothetical protein